MLHGLHGLSTVRENAKGAKSGAPDLVRQGSRIRLSDALMPTTPVEISGSFKLLKQLRRKAVGMMA